MQHLQKKIVDVGARGDGRPGGGGVGGWEGYQDGVVMSFGGSGEAAQPEGALKQTNWLKHV